jgi:benzoyl-CoA reductase/2-hydroxyglutaryl-CoA dehydratase subunit BcrC/BadD/HgdB
MDIWRDNMRILAMSGFIPEQICDVVRFNGYTGDRNISHYCGYANDFISQVLDDDSVDGAVFPRSCDSSRIIKSYLEKTNKFVHQINIPSRTDESAVKFFAGEVKRYKESVEEYYGVSLGCIGDRIELINERNQMILNSYNSLEKIPYGGYLRSVHDILSNPSTNIESLGKGKEGIRTYLVGSYLANEGIADIIENAGLAIVGDNLPESGRIAGRRTKTGGDLYLNIAEEILGRRLSPTQDNFRRIMENDMCEIKRLGCRAVVFVTQKYCEPYDYLYAVYRKRLDAEGIPSLRIVLNDSEEERRVSLAVEAFVDTL